MSYAPLASALYRTVTSPPVTMCTMARDRSDIRWQHLSEKEQWRERLRWARESHGSYPRAEKFAAAVGESAANYRKYERLPSDSANYAKDFPYAKAVAWADKLDVRWQWLLEGEGLPWRDEEAPLEKAARLLQGRPVEEQERIIEALTLLIDRKAS